MADKADTSRARWLRQAECRRIPAYFPSPTGRQDRPRSHPPRYQPDSRRDDQGSGSGPGLAIESTSSYLRVAASAGDLLLPRQTLVRNEVEEHVTSYIGADCRHELSHLTHPAYVVLDVSPDSRWIGTPARVSSRSSASRCTPQSRVRRAAGLKPPRGSRTRFRCRP
jgi:hypothetical protein